MHFKLLAIVAVAVGVQAGVAGRAVAVPRGPGQDVQFAPGQPARPKPADRLGMN